ncbi:MAG TPA: NAD(P)-dependent alcohol dehydrogenase [Acidimicrobiia bacterium]|nr:NAD(P)-dependent alcohol dehydrogenase [Acidimicrobiia bacterium]
MKAVVQDRYGSADVLELRDIARPEIGDDEVLVRVIAAGVDRGAWHFMTGVPYVMRIIGFGFRAPKVPVAGTNIAGRVDEVGKNVTRFRRGDEVYGTCRGAFAEYACAREEKLAPKPDRLAFEGAAVVPHGGFAALQGLRDRGRLQADQTVLIVGASGAVGSLAVQLAKAFGADVTGVCNTTTVDMVHALGADRVIDYTREDFANSGPYDLILDTGGNSALSRLRRALAPRGTLVIVGGERGRWIGMDRQIRAHMLSPFLGQRLGTFVARENADDLLILNEFIQSGKVTPLVARTYPLSGAPDAMRLLETGRARGRIAVTVRAGGNAGS